MRLLQELRKFAGKGRRRMRSVLLPQPDPYVYFPTLNVLSDSASSVSKCIRDAHRPPALMVYGVAPRSGTNFVANLLALHPGFAPWPNLIWEVPFLRSVNHLLAFEKEFFEDFTHNAERMQQYDFLPIFGASFIRYLHSFADEGKKVLLKEPDARNFAYFPLVFPHEQLLLLLRDGRDVVFSTIKTWPQTQFTDVCQRWNDSAKLMLKFSSKHQDNSNYWIMEYEDVLSNPVGFVKDACHRYSLEVSEFPFNEIESMPVFGSSTDSQKDGVVDWSTHKQRPDNFKPVGRWNNWSLKEKSIFKRIAGETLLQANYCEDLDW